MKFFDPKKKEQNSSTFPPSTPAPDAQPVSASRPTRTTPTPIPHPPAPAPVEVTTQVQADTAPTVMIPVPQAVPPEAPPAATTDLEPTAASTPESAYAASPAPVSAPAAVPLPEPPPQKPSLVTQRVLPQQTVIGATVMIKGDLTANESIVVDGFVEGSIETTGDVHVGMHGKVYATVRADNIKVSGKVVGNITASNKIELESTAVLEGNIRAPRLSISESALFRGSIDMRPVTTKEPGDDTQREKKPASASLEPA